MAKRILACTAALGGARYILADEITAWLDEGLACLLLGQLRELANQGSGILWVTHDLALAARFADRTVALHQGQVSDTLSCHHLRQGQGSERWQANAPSLPRFPDAGRPAPARQTFNALNASSVPEVLMLEVRNSPSPRGTPLAGVVAGR